MDLGNRMKAMRIRFIYVTFLALLVACSPLAAQSEDGLQVLVTASADSAGEQQDIPTAILSNAPFVDDAFGGSDGNPASATPLVTLAATEVPTPFEGLSAIGDQKIVFSSDASGNDEIYAVNLDGSELLQVTHYPETSEIFPQWSPDGTMLSFLSLSKNDDGGYDGPIRVISTGGRLLASVDGEDCNRIGGPFWSPDSKWVTVYCGEKVVFFRPDGSDAHVIEDVYWGDPNLIHWSQDGELIGVRTSGSLQVVDLDGNIAEVESGWIGRRSAPDLSYDFDFSPDGNSLVYIFAELIPLPGNLFDTGPAIVRYYDVNTTGIDQISPADKDLDFYFPQFISNDLILVAGMNREDFSGTGLYGLDIVSSHLVEYLPGISLDIYGDTYSLSPSRTKIAFTTNHELWLLDLQTGKTNYITLLNEPFYYIYSELQWSSGEDIVVIASTSAINVIDLSDGSQIVIDMGGESGGTIDIR